MSIVPAALAFAKPSSSCESSVTSHVREVRPRLRQGAHALFERRHRVGNAASPIRWNAAHPHAIEWSFASRRSRVCPLAFPMRRAVKRRRDKGEGEKGEGAGRGYRSSRPLVETIRSVGRVLSPLFLGTKSPADLRLRLGNRSSSFLRVLLRLFPAVRWSAGLFIAQRRQYNGSPVRRHALENTTRHGTSALSLHHSHAPAVSTSCTIRTCARPLVDF